jgi:hypothetical protein
MYFFDLRFTTASGFDDRQRELWFYIQRVGVGADFWGPIESSSTSLIFLKLVRDFFSA